MKLDVGAKAKMRFPNSDVLEVLYEQQGESNSPHVFHVCTFVCVRCGQCAGANLFCHHVTAYCIAFHSIHFKAYVCSYIYVFTASFQISFLTVGVFVCGFFECSFVFRNYVHTFDFFNILKYANESSVCSFLCLHVLSELHRHGGE